MRHLLFTLMMAGLFGCKDDSQTKPELEKNTFVVQRNGIKWGGETEIRYDSMSDSLIILGISNDSNDEAVIAMKIKFEGPGHYPLGKNQTVYYTTIGGDVITSEYKLASNSIGQLTVSKYYQEEKLLEGSFELKLEKERGHSQNYSNTIQLTEGVFKGNIKN